MYYYRIMCIHFFSNICYSFFFYISTLSILYSYLFFFFNDPATTEFYTYGHTLSLPDSLPCSPPLDLSDPADPRDQPPGAGRPDRWLPVPRPVPGEPDPFRGRGAARPGRGVRGGDRFGRRQRGAGARPAGRPGAGQPHAAAPDGPDGDARPAVLLDRRADQRHADLVEPARPGPGPRAAAARAVRAARMAPPDARQAAQLAPRHVGAARLHRQHPAPGPR